MTNVLVFNPIRKVGILTVTSFRKVGVPVLVFLIENAGVHLDYSDVEYRQNNFVSVILRYMHV